MDIIYLTVGDLLVNTIIIKKNNDCLIIDPGNDSSFLINYLETYNLTPKILLHTHGHFDHIGGSSDLIDHYNCIGFLSKYDTEIYKMYCQKVATMNDFSNHLDVSYFLPKLEVISTPGHSNGSVSFYTEGLLFSGDTLFARSIGRSDFYQGDESKLFKSLASLLQLPPQTKVIPGHGPFTTIASEKESNIFIGKINEAART